MDYTPLTMTYACRRCGRRRTVEPREDVERVGSQKPPVHTEISVEVPQDEVVSKNVPMVNSTRNKRRLWLRRHWAKDEDVQVSTEGREYIEVNGIREYLPPMFQI